MSSEAFEFGRAKWVTDVVNYPLVICPQPQGHVISLVFQSGWGGSSVEIQSVKIQNMEAPIVDTLIADKWYLNPDLFPDSISFPLIPTDRPGMILFQNGLAQKGVKKMVVMYDDEQIWTGDIPMATGDSAAVFAIPVPLKQGEFQRPNIKTFRNAKSIEFRMD
jgi:hypothetical protein